MAKYKDMGDAPTGSKPEIPEGYNPEEITKGKGIPKGKVQAGTSGSGGVMGAAAPPEPITSSSPTPQRTLAPDLAQLRAEGIRGIGGAETGPLGTNTNPLEPNPNPAGRARIVNTGSPMPNTANLSPNARAVLAGGAGAGAAGAGLLGAGLLPVITAGLGTGLAAYGATNQIIEDVPGLKKGIENIGAALHGPITEGTEKAPDLNFMDMNAPKGAGVPSPKANIKPASKTDMQTDLTAQAKPSPPNSPIDEGQFRGPTGKGVNYNQDNAGNMVPVTEGGYVNPYDKELQNVLHEMKYLSGLIVPAKSGIMADTVAANFDIFERQKKLEKIANYIQPLTSEGMKLPAKGIPQALHPVEVAAHEADIKLKNAQAEAVEPKTEVEDEKQANTMWKERNTFRAKLVQDNPEISDETLNAAEKKAGYVEPVKKKYRLTAKGKENIEVHEGRWGGRKFIDTTTGEEVNPSKKK